MKKIVTIGGGTGSYGVLSGLATFPVDITAVVTMFDSGGSSGVLRDEFGVLPPGDVRRCLVALSGERAGILRELFNYRFSNGTGLNGHSFGNLFLVALSNIYGGDLQGIEKASELLELNGRVLPVSLDKAHVHATLENGQEIVGEKDIYTPQHDGNLRITSVTLEPNARLYEGTAEAIRDADVIVICPGSLYASLVPNFLVEGMREALAASAAKKVVVCDLMTQWGQTNGYGASDMVRELIRYSGIKKFDYALCNTAPMRNDMIEAYAKERKYPVVWDAGLEECASTVITGDFFSESDIARHDPEKLGKVLADL